MLNGGYFNAPDKGILITTKGKEMKTIRDLRKAIEELPDDMEVVGSGHYGERRTTYSIQVGVVDEQRCSSLRASKKMEALIIEIEDCGEEPD